VRHARWKRLCTGDERDRYRQCDGPEGLPLLLGTGRDDDPAWRRLDRSDVGQQRDGIEHRQLPVHERRLTALRYRFERLLTSPKTSTVNLVGAVTLANLPADITVSATGGAGTGLGAAQDKTATIDGLITPANFGAASPDTYSKTVTVAIEAIP
jgi:hypothetical protein